MKAGRLSLGKIIAEHIDCCHHCDFGTNAEHRCVQVKPDTVKAGEVYLFVDEFPSDVEHVLSEPLQGASSAPLKQILYSFLPPEKVYVGYQSVCATCDDKILEHHKKACLPNLQLIISTLEPKAIFALGSKVSKFLTKSGITHTELPTKFSVCVDELARQRTRLTLKQFFNEKV